MRRLASSRVIIPAIVLSIFYWLVSWFVPRQAMADAINGMLIAFSFTVVMAYAAGAWEAVRSREFGRLQHLMIGIVLAWFVTLVIRIWGFLFVNLGRPEWMVNHPLVFYFYFLLCMAAVLHLTAPTDADASKVASKLGFTRQAAKLLAFGLILGSFISFIIIKWVHL